MPVTKGVLMRLLISVAVVLSALVALPLAAQPFYCFGGSPQFCQYLPDEGFDYNPSYWTFTGGSSRNTVTDPCYSGTTPAATLAPGYGVFQWVDTEDESEWAISLQVFFSDAGGTSADTVIVEITNVTLFNQTEQFYISAADYGTCANIYIPLTNNYNDASVRVKVWLDYESTMSSVAVDNITFWGGPFI
ncbi:MAG: hypothetical protein M3P06_14080 [Acidobacteriota bacterium]|nr:hypothetical protein [Acidobacteriota bacterium]